MNHKREDRSTVRETCVTVPMTKAEKEAVTKEANKRGITRSAYIRLILSQVINGYRYFEE